MRELPANNLIKPSSRILHLELKSQLPADKLIPQLFRQTPTRRKWYCILMILLGCLLWTSAGATGITEEALPDAFTDVIGKLSSLTDRSTGTAGNQEAALYIKEKLEQLGYSDLGSYRFSVPVMRNEKSTLILANRNIQIDLHPISGNAVTPQTVAPPGLSGPLIYAGRGELKHLNFKQIADSIILMELDSGKNWLQAANLGASALIYIDRGESPKIFFEEKFELSPLQFPRFWISRAQAKEVFGDFENAPGGQIAAEAQLTSRIRWQLASSENIYCFVTGTDPMLKERLIMVEAFYDSTPTVAGLSPGADEAVGVATLLELARFLKEHPPKRSVLLIASSGHAQSLAGMREMIWSISARSKDLRGLKKSYRALAKKTRKTIKLLKNMSLDSATRNESADVCQNDEIPYFGH